MLQKLRENKAIQGFLLILPSNAWMIALLIIPLVLSVVTSFGRRDSDGNVIYTFTLDNYTRLAGMVADPQCGLIQWAGDVGRWLIIPNVNTVFGWLNLPAWEFAPGPCFDDLYATILSRSLVLAFQSTTLVILLAYPLSYFVARSSPRARNTLLFLILVPLWTNFVIRIYAWIMILRGQGVLNSVIGWIVGLLGGHYAPLDLYPSEGAVLVGMVYEFLPFMILPIYTSLEKIDPSLYEAAADLGANATRTFLRVTLPLSMPGVVAGTILVFIPVMGSFVVSDILGGRQVILVGNLIQNQFLSARNPAFGSASSIILMALTLIVTLIYVRRFGLGEEIASA